METPIGAIISGNNWLAIVYEGCETIISAKKVRCVLIIQYLKVNDSQYPCNTFDAKLRV